MAHDTASRLIETKVSVSSLLPFSLVGEKLEVQYQLDDTLLSVKVETADSSLAFLITGCNKLTLEHPLIPGS